MSLPLPVHDMLAPSNEVRPAWAKFDAPWYLRKYPEASEHCGGKVEAALNYYLNVGMALKHSPSPLFDEAYYLDENPDIATLVGQKKYHSGFDHFCQHGHRLNSPHWLFDDVLYGRLYDDMSLQNLDFHGCAGRYDHYLKSGQFEGRQCHFIFDAEFFREKAISAGAAAADIDFQGSFTHYLYRLSEQKTEISPSIFFDPLWYLNRDSGLKKSLEDEHFCSAIEHYLRNQNPNLFDPLPEFSEVYYCESNKDVRDAIENGRFRCGYQHFVQFGAFELRRPHPQIDLVLYVDSNPSVRDDLNAGKSRDAFSHLRTIGIPGGLSYGPAAHSVQITEEAAKANFLQRAKDNAVLASFQKLDFRAERPVVSVIMIAFNKFDLTMSSLTSLRNNFNGQIQLIFLDNGSSDQIKHIDRYLVGAKIIHLDENIGYLLAANLALDHVTAPATLYLNNDIQLGFNAINAALQTLQSSTRIGAVGGKIVRFHGKLQEAGSIIWNDGTTAGYMRDEDPLRSEVNFLREVDYCSAVFLLCQSHLLKSLNGFDAAFSPAYYEDSDLCIRIFQSEYQILYDPRVVVYHFEFASIETSEAASALMTRGRKLFCRKHETYLKTKYARAEENILRARSNRTSRRILFVEDTVPLRTLGSGFVRSNDVVQAMTQHGYDVSIFPVNGTNQFLSDYLSAFPDRVEILYDFDFTDLQEFLLDRQSYYDLIWVSRTHNLNRLVPRLIGAGYNPSKTPVVLDSEAIVAVREAHRLAVAGANVVETFNLIEELSKEFNEAEICSHVTAVNAEELSLLESLKLPSLSLLGTCCRPRPTPNNFSNRYGLLFVASIHQADSPNLDSLRWLRDAVLPRLKQKMATPPMLNFLGYVDKDIDLSEFNPDHGIQIHGPAEDLTPYYNENRVFIAPTRFAAGTPYKMYEAASFGLPCVATDLLARQLGWDGDSELLTAPVTDPDRFAVQIATLYQTEAIWRKLRENALRRIESENDPQTFNAKVQMIIEDALCGTNASSSLSRIGKRRTPRKPVTVR
jgi:GT2 family glycosyltransferase